MDDTYDVIIIGAGPSGSYLAAQLAHMSYRVLVLEQKSAAGQDACCTGIIGAEAYRSLFLEAKIYRKARSAKFFAPSGDFLRLEREETQAYIVDRSSLDISLYQRAEGAGAEFRFNTAAKVVTPAEKSISVRAESEGERLEFTARVVVLACGLTCRFPQELGMGNIANFAYGTQAEVTLNDIDEVEVYFDQERYPDFFGWLVPTTEGHGLAGLITDEKPVEYLNDMLTHLEEQGKIVPADHHACVGLIPFDTLPESCNNRVIALGDAAGQVKPTTGGGIYYGMLSAQIAAKVLHQAFSESDFSAGMLSFYDDGWHRRLDNELKSGYRSRRLYHKLKNKHLDHWLQVARKQDLPHQVAEGQDFSFDWHSTVVMKIVKGLSLSPIELLRMMRD